MHYFYQFNITVKWYNSPFAPTVEKYSRTIRSSKPAHEAMIEATNDIVRPQWYQGEFISETVIAIPEWY